MRFYFAFFGVKERNRELRQPRASMWGAPLKRSEREMVNQSSDELQQREIIRRARVRHHLEGE
jgi:hypothetical protein